MKILQVVPHLEIGGAEHVASFLAFTFQDPKAVSLVAFSGGALEGLLREKGVRTTVIEPLLVRLLRQFRNRVQSINENLSANKNTMSISIPTRRYSYLRKLYYKRFEKWFQKQEYDIVHLHTLDSSPLFEIVKKKGVRVIYGHHNILSERHCVKDINLLRERLNFVDRVVCVSKTSASDFIKSTAIPEEKVEVIYNPSFFVRNDFEQKQQNNKSFPLDSRLIVGTISNLEGAKGIKILLEAWKKLILLGWNIQLHVAGGKPYIVNYWRDQAKKIGIQNYVRFWGLLKSGDEVNIFYQTINVLVIPSLSESFSLQAIEAMSRSIPVLASDIPSLREIVGGGGCFFERGSADDLVQKIIALSKLPEYRSQVSKAARKQFELFFDSRIVIQQYRNLYLTELEKRIQEQ